MKIALVTDTHLAAVAVDFTANCIAAMAWVDRIGADLVVHLGDITADGVADQNQHAFARSTFDRLKTPIRFLPGNHDIGDNPPPAHAEPIVQPHLLTLFRKLFGPDWWCIEAAGWKVLGLNALLFGLGNDEESAQFDWMDECLQDFAGPVGVMLHKPFFRNDPSDDDPHPRYVRPGPRARLLARLARHDLRFVVCGHTHQLRSEVIGGVEHVWAPSTAFILPDDLQEKIGEKCLGAMILTLAPKGHAFAYLCPEGIRTNVLTDYQDVFPKLRKLGR